MKEHIKTSINVNRIYQCQLLKIQNMTGFSKEKICKKVLYFLIRKTNKNVIIKKESIKYQPKTGGFKPITLNLSREEYEFFLNIRSSFRISISYLVAIAFDIYGEKILWSIKQGDKNRRRINNLLNKSLSQIILPSYGIFREIIVNNRKIYYFFKIYPQFY
jgi:hypothetical protein